MKAVLVIDVPSYIPLEQMAIDYEVNRYDIGEEEIVTSDVNVPLKPLPDCPDVPDTIANDVAYIIGWNDCIVEISKERKEAKSLIKNEKESVSNANGTSIE